ncbi:RNI-like protein [Hesseltinella vesiculosa]|uniref:RNI-like protein n=1 Tax=Hesseltinella vesiculosa TaxID=101127 RepID=A0A1X2GIR2_9FUNG|nr:RNI-like protein [Hesseltinella vesiculosa]
MQAPLGHFVRQLVFHESPSDAILSLFIQNAHLLEELVITKAIHITDHSMMDLARSCQQLKKLHLEHANITHRSIHFLGQTCPRLSILILRTCSKLSPFTLLPLAHCPLAYLDLSGCRWLTTDDTALDLLPFDNLTHLELMCCRTIQASFLQFLSTPQQRTSRPVAQSTNRTSATAASTSTTTTTTMIPLPNLSFFALTGNADMEDYAIIAFVQSHTLLQELHLLQCDITDASLLAIQTSLPLLHGLDISYCEHVSPIGVRRLIRHHTSLLMIGLHGCRLPLSAFPEAKTALDNDVVSLFFDEIAAIRLTSDDDDMLHEEQDLPPDDHHQPQTDEDLSDADPAEPMDQDDHDHLPPAPHVNDDMLQVQAMILSLPHDYRI